MKIGDVIEFRGHFCMSPFAHGDRGEVVGQSNDRKTWYVRIFASSTGNPYIGYNVGRLVEISENEPTQGYWFNIGTVK